MDLIDDIPSILMAEPSILLFLLCLANNKVQNDNIFYKKLYYYAAAKVTLNNDNKPEPQLHVETVLKTTNLHTAGTEAAGSTGIMLQLSKLLAWEHPTKQRVKEGHILEVERFKPSCYRNAKQGARRSVALQPGWQRSHPKRPNSHRAPPKALLEMLSRFLPVKNSSSAGGRANPAFCFNNATLVLHFPPLIPALYHG